MEPNTGDESEYSPGAVRGISGIDWRTFATRDEGVRISPFDGVDRQTYSISEEQEPEPVEDNREEIFGHVRDMVAMGDLSSGLQLLQSVGISEQEAVRLVLRFQREENDVMPSKIRRYLRGEKVDGVDDNVIEEYYAKEKKLRFLVKDERDGLHKPLSDGKKPTSSVKLDDLVPKD